MTNWTVHSGHPYDKCSQKRPDIPWSGRQEVRLKDISTVTTLMTIVIIISITNHLGNTERNTIHEVYIKE